MSDDVYLTTADAVAYLRTTMRTLYRRLGSGEIPAVRMGRQWRFRKRDLDRWLTQQPSDAACRSLDNLPNVPLKPRVLVVDDEPAVGETVSRMLAIGDCDVEAVLDGATALTRLQSASYDLVITDLKMPGVDGIEVAREAKRMRPGIKVIIVTGYPSQESAIDAANIGVHGYLTKPFRPMDVLMATARALDLVSIGGSRKLGTVLVALALTLLPSLARAQTTHGVVDGHIAHCRLVHNQKGVMS
jgi:excisionase family DNA binding protein